MRDYLALAYIKELAKEKSVSAAKYYTVSIFDATLRIEAQIAIAAITKNPDGFTNIYFDILRSTRIELHNIRAKLYALLAKASRDKAHITASIEEIRLIPLVFQGESLCHLAEACVWIGDVEQARRLAQSIGDQYWRAKTYLAIAKALMDQPNN